MSELAQAKSGIKIFRKTSLEKIASLSSKILSKPCPWSVVCMALLHIRSVILRKLFCKVWCMLLWCQHCSAQPVWTDTHNECPRTESPSEETQTICNFIVCLGKEGKRVLQWGEEESLSNKNRPSLEWKLVFLTQFFVCVCMCMQFYIGDVLGDNLLSLLFSSLTLLDFRLKIVVCQRTIVICSANHGILKRFMLLLSFFYFIKHYYCCKWNNRYTSISVVTFYCWFSYQVFTEFTLHFIWLEHE